MRGTDDLERRLSRVDERIARHPFSSVPVSEAFAVIEKHGKEHVDAISRELAEKGLPALDSLGRLQLRGSLSWWSLHRRRRALVRRLERAG